MVVYCGSTKMKNKARSDLFFIYSVIFLFKDLTTALSELNSKDELSEK